MNFAKRQLPLIICFLMGVIFAIQYYVPHQASENMLTQVNDWMLVIGIFGIALGLYSVIHLNMVKIKRQAPGWGFSTILIFALVVTFVIGMMNKGATVTPDFQETSFGWIYNKMLVSLGSTVFSILAFFIASVAFRTFRARSFEAFLLMAAAIIVMFGRVPLGEYIWGLTIGKVITSIPTISSITEWIMQVLNMAGRRGILLGVMLGGIATAIKIILGIERAYLGGKE